MVYSVGTAILQVVPSFTGLQTKTKEAARDIQKQLADAIRQGLTDGLGSGPALAPAKRTGTQVGSTLANSIKSQLQAALRSLPEPKIGAVTTEAEQKVRDLREQIATLTARIGVDLNSADAAREIADIQAQLEALSAGSTDLDIRADTERAAAALARVKAEIDRLEGRTATVSVDIVANEGRFAARLKAAVEAAQTALPDINIDISSTAAEVQIATLRARLETLRGREVDVDISAADALAELTAIRAELDALAASDADVRVDVDAAAASAELASFEALVAAVDGNDIDVDVNTGPGIGAAPGRIIAIAVALASLLPALAPISAVAAGALGGIGAAAVTALPGLATLAFALFGVFEAVRQLSKANQDAAKSAETIAAAHAASVGAARGVEQAEAGLANTRASAAAQSVQAARSVEQAKKREGDAVEAAARSEADAAERVVDAQKRLEKAVRDAAEGAQQANQRVIDAETDAAEAAASASRRVEDAKRDLARAAEDASDRVQSSLDRQADAERSLAQAQRDAKDAQDAITDARKKADEQLQDLTLNVEQGAIRQKQAVFDAQEAQADLIKVLADPKATQREKEQAQLRVDAALQSVKEIQLRNARLQSEQAERQAQGIEGQDVYTDAVARANQAVQRQGDAEADAAKAAADTAKARRDADQSLVDAKQQLADATAAQTKAELDGTRAVAEARTAQARQERDAAESIAAAQKTRTDADADAIQAELDGQARIAEARDAVNQAVVAQGEQQRQSAFSIASAVNGVTSARDAAARAAAAEGKAVRDAGADARDALAALTPVGAAFAVFLYSLRTPLGELRAAAQESFLPGLQAGLEALLPVMPTFVRLTEVFGKALGDLATRFGESFSGPTFQRFFAFLDRQVPDTLDKLGTLFGNVFGGILDLFVGFEPYLQPFLDGLNRVTGAFANFAAGLAQNQAFQDFIAYLIAEAPQVSQFFGQLIEFLVRLGIAFAPLGEVILQLFIYLFEFLNSLGPDGLLAVLTLIAGAILALAVAFEAPVVAIIAIVVAITSFIGLLVRLYQTNETFRDIVDAVWGFIRDTIVGYWQNFLLPTLRAFRDFIVDTVAPALQNFWKNVVEPAFAGISAAVKFAWENVMKPALDALVFIWQKVITPALDFLWHQVFAPAFSAIGTIISVWWAAASIIFDALVYVFDKAIRPALEFLWRNVFEPAFSGIGSAVKVAWEQVISPALEALRKFFVETLGPAIQTGVSAFTSAWALMKAAAAKPINFIIETVYTNGIKKLFDKVAETVKSDTRMPVIDKIPEDVQGLATGGPVRGFSPSKTADNIPIWATAREFMQPVDAVDYYGTDTMEAIRRKAIPRELFQGLARGGSVDSLVELGKRLQGMGIRVSENRFFGGVSPTAHAPGGWHYKLGNAGALDINLGTGNPKGEKEALDKAIGFANSQDFRTIWQAQGHLDHGHIDLGSGPSIGSKGTGGGLSGLIGSLVDGVSALGSSAAGVLGDLWKGATDVLSPFTDLAKKAIDGVGGGPFGELAGKTVTSGIDLVKDWVSKQIGSLFGGGQDTGPLPVTGGKFGPNVEKWRALGLQALQITGKPAADIDSLLRRLGQESSGDPRSINLTDSNAKKGIPSKGLMQVIDPTFRRWALPGYDRDIYDPLSNMIASIRYASNFPGGPTARWDRAGGYAQGGSILDRLGVAPKPLLFDSGGYLPPGANLVVNNLGRPEPLGNLEDLVTPASRSGGDGALMQSLFRDVYPSEKADWELAFREAGFALSSAGLGG